MAVQDGDTKKWILRELQRLFLTLKPWLEVPPETYQGYAGALDSIASPAEMTVLTNKAIKHRWPNLGWPSPGELIDMLGDMRERMPDKKEANTECSQCLGTGYLIEECPEPKLPYTPRVAVPCECRRDRAASSA